MLARFSIGRVLIIFSFHRKWPWQCVQNKVQTSGFLCPDSGWTMCNFLPISLLLFFFLSLIWSAKYHHNIHECKDRLIDLLFYNLLIKYQKWDTKQNENEHTVLWIWALSSLRLRFLCPLISNSVLLSLLWDSSYRTDLLSLSWNFSVWNINYIVKIRKTAVKKHSKIQLKCYNFFLSCFVIKNL